MSESINDKAREWCEKINGDHLDPRDFYPSSTSVDAYTAGYNQCEKDIREKASEGFEDWWNELEHIFTTMPALQSKKAWQAATLSAEKRHAEEIRLKDERIARLEMFMREYLNNAPKIYLTSIAKQLSSKEGES